MADTWGAATPPPNDVVEHVLDVVRQLARETGGSRAERAVSAQASLEREVGLGSLERVELMARLERAFARPLDDVVRRRCRGVERVRHSALTLCAGRPRAQSR